MAFVNDTTVMNNHVLYCTDTTLARSASIGKITGVLNNGNGGCHTDRNFAKMSTMWTINANICLLNRHFFPSLLLYSALAGACRYSIEREGGKDKERRRHNRANNISKFRPNSGRKKNI